MDMPKLERWLAIAGKRVGLGDWRPQKSGEYGRFDEVHAILKELAIRVWEHGNDNSQDITLVGNAIDDVIKERNGTEPA